MALISDPPSTQLTDDPSIWQGWASFFSSVSLLLGAITQSGTTANRPTKYLWVGRPYWDTSLAANGKPIWVNKLGTGWVDATGAAV